LYAKANEGETWSLVRSNQVTETECDYSQAERLSDQLSTYSLIKCEVSQISNQVGRGFQCKEYFNV
ncbi:MAG: hypothetical protein N4A65_01520, partial [Cohaesibacter sp.]|nr:hypothetical protein [Cohaesibacter sp.]